MDIVDWSTVHNFTIYINHLKFECLFLKYRKILDFETAAIAKKNLKIGYFWQHSKQKQNSLRFGYL